MKTDTGSIPVATPVRASQRDATRKRVLSAAWDLFVAQGYEGTTIRDIARDAGVAVGTVFTAFASKAEILSQVMEVRRASLSGELARVLPHLRGLTIDRLRTMFAAHIQFEMQYPRLILAHIAASYEAAPIPFGQNTQLRSALIDCLTKGVAQGDVSADIDLEDVATLLVGTQAWAFRLAATEGADARSMIAVMDRQIGLIVEGIGARS